MDVTTPFSKIKALALTSFLALFCGVQALLLFSDQIGEYGLSRSSLLFASVLLGVEGVQWVFLALTKLLILEHKHSETVRLRKLLINRVSSHRVFIDKDVFLRLWRDGVKKVVDWRELSRTNLVFASLGFLAFYSLGLGLSIVNSIFVLSISFTVWFVSKKMRIKESRLANLNLKLRSFMMDDLAKHIEDLQFYSDRGLSTQKGVELQNSLDERILKRNNILRQVRLQEATRTGSLVVGVLVIALVVGFQSPLWDTVIFLSLFFKSLFLFECFQDYINCRKKPENALNQLNYYLTEDLKSPTDLQIPSTGLFFDEFLDLEQAKHTLLLVDAKRVEEVQQQFRYWISKKKYGDSWSILDAERFELEELKETHGVSLFSPSKTKISPQNLKDFRDQFSRSFSIDSIPVMAFEGTDVYYVDQDQKVKMVQVKENFSRLSGDKGLILRNWKTIDSEFDKFYTGLQEKILSEDENFLVYQTFETVHKSKESIKCPGGGYVVLHRGDEEEIISANLAQAFSRNLGKQKNIEIAKNFLANCAYIHSLIDVKEETDTKTG